MSKRRRKRRPRESTDVLVWEMERPAVSEVEIKRGEKRGIWEVCSTFGEPELVDAEEAKALRKALANPHLRRHVPIAVTDWADRRKRWWPWGRRAPGGGDG